MSSDFKKNKIFRRGTLAGVVLALALSSSGSIAKDSKDDGYKAELLISKGNTEMIHGNYDNAILDFFKAQEYAPNSTKILNNLAEAYLKQGSEPMAIIQYENSLKADSTQVETSVRLARLYQNVKRWQDSGNLYKKILEMNPENDEAALEFGNLFLMAKQPGPAASVLEGYVNRNTGNKHVDEKYIEALSQTNQYQKIVDISDKILEAFPDDEIVLRHAAIANAKIGNFEKSISYFLIINKKTPLVGEEAFLAGRSFLKIGVEGDAIPFFESALNDTTDFKADWHEIGSAFMKNKRYDLAARSFQRKIEAEPNSASAYLNLGLCLQQQKEYASSNEAISKSMELKPDFIVGTYYIAANYASLEDKENARGEYSKFIGMAHNNEEKYKRELIDSHTYIAVIKMVDKEYESALVDLNWVIKNNPNDPEIQLYKAQALLSLDRREESRRELERIVHAFPNNEKAKKGLEFVQNFIALRGSN